MRDEEEALHALARLDERDVVIEFLRRRSLTIVKRAKNGRNWNTAVAISDALTHAANCIEDGCHLGAVIGTANSGTASLAVIDHDPEPAS